METNYAITVYNTADRCNYLPHGSVVLIATPTGAGAALAQLTLLKEKFPAPEYEVIGHTDVVTTIRLDGIVTPEFPGYESSY